MFGISFKIALRHLWRNKTYSLLNLAGLTFGLTCAILAILYILHVTEYDKFQKHYDRLFTVDAYVTYFNGDRFPKEYLSASLPDLLKVQAPEIEEMTRVAGCQNTFFDGEKSFSGSGYYADENFFEVFSFPLMGNNTAGILSELNSIVISENMALKFFEGTNCVGKNLMLNEGGDKSIFKVVGVFQQVPSRSSLQFDFVIPFTRFLANNPQAMGTGASTNLTWVLLKKGADRKMVENKIKNLIRNQETTRNQELFLFPLKEKVLYTYAGGRRVWKEMQNLVLVGSIGFAILLIACFNFVNLAVALNIRRYREAGIKKTAGADKLSIVMQFLGETLLVTLFSLIGAIFLVRLVLDGFNTLFNKELQFMMLDFNMILFFVLVTLFTVLASGLLPGLYLASSNPVNVLKGKMVTSHSFGFFRQGLIVFQFVIPVALVIIMMVIKVQDRYMRNFNVGVDQDRLMILDNSVNIQQHQESFKAELLAIPEISSVSFTNCIPSRGFRPSSEISWEGKDASEKLHFWCINTDFDYNKAVDVKMVEGRYFNPSFSSDSTGFLINDVATKVMHLRNPVGSSLVVEGQKGTILGTFKGFHVIDLAGPIVPTIIRIKKTDRPVVLVKFSSGGFSGLAEKIRKVYKNYDAEEQFRPVLFRDLTSYSNLNLPANLVGMAFLIAIVLACMGFFGLASFSAESRTKEIGIRRTNGATVHSIMGLLLKSYTKWLSVAILIAWPLAFFLGRVFLGRFHFHTPIPVWAFILGPLIATIIALLTVVTQSWKVANRNPVKSLRYE